VSVTECVGVRCAVCGADGHQITADTQTCETAEIARSSVLSRSKTRKDVPTIYASLLSACLKLSPKNY
jgi:hypothetical protein